MFSCTGSETFLKLSQNTLMRAVPSVSKPQFEETQELKSHNKSKLIRKDNHVISAGFNEYLGWIIQWSSGPRGKRPRA